MSQDVKGAIKSRDDAQLVFVPLNTNYELSLRVDQPIPQQPGDDLQGSIRLVARKLWTVPAGGSFIQPLFGEPHWVQGRIQAVEGDSILVQAGTLLRIQVPKDPSAQDLKNGPLVAGALVNATILPGATFVPSAK